MFLRCVSFHLVVGNAGGPVLLCSYLYSASRFQKLPGMFSEVNFMANLFMDKRVSREAKSREYFRTAILCILCRKN